MTTAARTTATAEVIRVHSRELIDNGASARRDEATEIDASTVVVGERLGAEPTSYLRELVRRVENALSERLIGVWLVGSAALGDFDPRRSDLDVQAIAVERLPEAELTSLATDLSHESLPCPARALEFVLYARDGLTDPDGPAFQLNLNTGSEMSSHIGLDPRAERRFWFVVDVAIARGNAVPVVGPPAAAAWPELPRAMVAMALREALEWYAAEDGSGVGALLAACRSLAWATDGVWRSKRDAAEWARGRIPEESVDIALASREQASVRHLDPRQLAAVLELARAALDEAAP